MEKKVGGRRKIYKHCPKCKKVKHRKYFYNSLTRKDALTVYCKKCSDNNGLRYRKNNRVECIERYRKYYLLNKDKINKRQTIWRNKNKDRINKRANILRKKNKNKINKRLKIWRDKNKLRLNKKAKEWRRNNRDKTRKYCKEHYSRNKQKRLDQAARYRDLHREELRAADRKRIKANRGLYRERSRIYRGKYPERTRERARNWRINNPAKARLLDNKRKERMRNAEGEFTEQDLIEIYNKQNGECAYKDYGNPNCAIKIEWPSKHTHIEHILPLSKGGTNWTENLCLSCKNCNGRKLDKNDKEFKIYLDKCQKDGINNESNSKESSSFDTEGKVQEQ